MQASGLSGQSSSSVPGGVGGGGGSVVSLSSSSDRPSVGVEWIQEEKDSMGRVVNYKCELCKCDMNNVYMRDEHLKGRKHLTEFKMKIQPNLKVADPKLQSEFNRIERVRQQNEQEELKRRQVCRSQASLNRLAINVNLNTALIKFVCYNRYFKLPGISPVKTKYETIVFTAELYNFLYRFSKHVANWVNTRKN